MNQELHEQVSIAICTRDRPDSLWRCLSSIAQSGHPPCETVVSDDGVDRRTDEVVDEFRHRLGRLRLIRGPRLGLAANRNNCIAQVTGDFMLFLDDDARLDRDFLQTAIRSAGADRLVTGFEWRGTAPVRAHDPDFLGFLQANSGTLRSIVINATLFPTVFLRHHWFDEFFRFGSEEADIAMVALQDGLSIVEIDAANYHDTAPESREGNAFQAVRSRAYFGVQRYRKYEPNLGRLALFSTYGMLNAVGGAWRRGGLRQCPPTAIMFAEGMVKGIRHRPRRRVLPLERTGVASAVHTSIVIPSWRRPAELAACLEGVFRLSPPADEVIVVRREDDTATGQVVATAPGAVVDCIVDEPGQIAAMFAGAQAAQGDVVAFIDDDAVPRSDWLEHLLSPYGDPKVGAVGGRDVVHHGGRIERGAVARVGTVSRIGRVAGAHHLGAGVAREVHHLKGVNMSFRRDLFAVPEGLRGDGAQVCNELAPCLSIKRRGWKVVYDPRAIVDHYPAPRFDEDGRRHRSRTAVANAVFNQSYTLLSLRPSATGRIVQMAYGVLVGDRGSPGLLRAAIGAARREREVCRNLPVSLRAQWEAWREASRAPLRLRPVQLQRGDEQAGSTRPEALARS